MNRIAALLIPALLAGVLSCSGNKNRQKSTAETAGNQDTARLHVGDPAPLFSSMDGNGNEFHVSDFVGRKYLVLYFYPAAMTGGCTKQACAYRDELPELEELDVQVVGISGDYVENLKYFKEANNLNFPLLSDPTGMIAKMYGVPLKEGGEIQRTIGGEDVLLRRGVTTARWTFVIDKEGKIIYINQAVDAPNDSKQVLAVIRKKSGT